MFFNSKLKVGIGRIKLLGLLVFASSCGNLQAQITPSQADSFLLNTPAYKYKLPQSDNLARIEALAAPMFSSVESTRYGQGFQNFQVLLNRAKNENEPYALYNVGMYMMLNKDKINFKLSEALVYLNKASELGVVDAKYALALIYRSQFMEVSTLVNTENKNPLKLSTSAKKELQQQISKDADAFKQVAQQYILEAARLGHEKAFLMSCTSYQTGEFLPKNNQKAAVCYNNAIRYYDSSSAYGLLAKIYFSDPVFDSFEYETKGVELAKKGMEKNDSYAMAILGKQLVYPKHLNYSNAEVGVKLIQAAAAIGEPTGISYARQYLDGAGRLLVQPTKPAEPKLNTVDQKNRFSLKNY